MSNINSKTIQVKLTTGVIGISDKYIVYGKEFDTESQAEAAIKEEAFEQIDLWLDDDRERLVKDFRKLSKSGINSFITLFNDLINTKGE